MKDPFRKGGGNRSALTQQAVELRDDAEIALKEHQRADSRKRALRRTFEEQAPKLRALPADLPKLQKDLKTAERATKQAQQDAKLITQSADAAQRRVPILANVVMQLSHQILRCNRDTGRFGIDERTRAVDPQRITNLHKAWDAFLGGANRLQKRFDNIHAVSAFIKELPG